MMRKNLPVILFAFMFGQGIQLVTVALSRYLWISDPVMVCIVVAIMTTALVILTAVFTLMDEDGKFDVPKERPGAKHKALKIASGISPISFGAKRPPLDTDPEDIDEVDINLFKEAEKELAKMDT